MKKGILYLFLLTYSTVMFKPLLPYFKDIFAHLLFFKDHMATVHAHQGKYHVHDSIAEAEKKAQSENSTDNLKKDNHSPDHVLINQFSQTLCTLSSNHLFPADWVINQRNISQDYPPPQL